MSTARDAYEFLVGANSGMGVGDFKELMERAIHKHLGRIEDGPVNVLDDEAEEFLREIADRISTEDDFDVVEEAATEGSDEEIGDLDELDEEDEADLRKPLEGETIEDVPPDEEAEPLQ